jgi:GAF domain-containing protein
MLISSHTSFNDTLDSILKMALEVTDAKYGIFRLVNKTGTQLVAHSVAGENLVKPATESLPIDCHSVMGTVAIEREPLIISDLREEPWKDVYYPFDHELTMRSELAVPLIGASGRLEGVLNLESPQLNAFSKQDRYIMQILATQAVAAIQEVRLLDAIQEITALVLTESLQRVYQALVEKASDLLNVPCALLWLREENNLVIQAASNPGLQGWRVDLADSHTGRITLKGAAAISWETKADLPENINGINQFGPCLIVPILTPGESIHSSRPSGALSIFYAGDGQHDFDQVDWDKNVLTILSDYATLAIQNAAHQEAVKAAQERHTVTEAFAAIGDIASNLMHRLNNKIGSLPVRTRASKTKAEPPLKRMLTSAIRSPRSSPAQPKPSKLSGRVSFTCDR